MHRSFLVLHQAAHPATVYFPTHLMLCPSYNKILHHFNVQLKITPNISPDINISRVMISRQNSHIEKLLHLIRTCTFLIAWNIFPEKKTQNWQGNDGLHLIFLITEAGSLSIHYDLRKLNAGQLLYHDVKRKKKVFQKWQLNW